MDYTGHVHGGGKCVTSAWSTLERWLRGTGRTTEGSISPYSGTVRHDEHLTLAGRGHFKGRFFF